MAPLHASTGVAVAVRRGFCTSASLAFPKMTPFQRLQLWGVWGGVPRYWELQEDEPTLWRAIRRHVTAPFGLLRNEPNHLLLDDVGDAAQASAVLAFIGFLWLREDRMNVLISVGQKACA